MNLLMRGGDKGQFESKTEYKRQKYKYIIKMIYSSVLFRIRVGYKNTKNPLSKYHNMDKILFVNLLHFQKMMMEMDIGLTWEI